MLTLRQFIEQRGETISGMFRHIARGGTVLRSAETEKGIWVECVTKTEDGSVSEIMFSEKGQPGYGKVFRLCHRLAQGSVHIPDLVKRHNLYPVGKQVNLA